MDETINSDASAEQTQEEEKKEETPESQAPSKDPIKEELDKVKNRGEGKTELERALYKKQQLDKRIAELKGTTGEEIAETDEDKPVTVKMLREIQREDAQKTALQLAEDIKNEYERELTKHHISNTIKPTGNPNEDLRLARAIVNSVRNSQIVEEAARKVKAKEFSNGTSAGEKFEEEFTPTTEEATLMQGFGLSKEEVLEARKKAQK